MSEESKAKLFMDGRSQAVRLPDDLRLPGTEVRVTRVGRGIMLEPLDKPTLEQMRASLAELDRLKHIPFMENGREQPPMPEECDLPAGDR